MMADLALPHPGDLALTVWQPWADLIVAGVKDVENRSWAPPSTLPQWEVCVVCDTRRTREANDLGPDCLCEYPTRGSLLDDGPFPFRLWIHAGKQPDASAPAWVWGSLPGGLGRVSGRYGVLLGSVEVTGCHHADECMGRVDECDCGAVEIGEAWVQHEPRCGEQQPCSRWAEPDAFHWTLTDARPLDTPTPMAGRQRLWRITADDKENHR